MAAGTASLFFDLPFSICCLVLSATFLLTRVDLQDQNANSKVVASGMVRSMASSKPLMLAATTVLTSLLLAQCGSGNGSSQWSGTWTEGPAFPSGSLSFEILNDNAVFCFKLSGIVADLSTPCQNPAANSIPIGQNQFSLTYPESEGVGYILTGTFTSPTQANGEMDCVPADNCRDLGPLFTWTASRN